MDLCPKVEALISQHPTRVLPLCPTNLHHNRQQNLSKCTPINLMKTLLTQPKLRPPLMALYWQWSTNPFTPLMMMLQASAMSFQSRGLPDSGLSALPISACQSHQPTIGRPWCKWRPCWFRHVCHPQNPPQD